MDFPREFEQVEKFLDSIPDDAGEQCRDEMIDIGARVQRLGRRMIAKSDDKDREEIEGLIVEISEMVSAVIGTVDLFHPLVATLRTTLGGLRAEWRHLQELKRSAGGD